MKLPQTVSYCLDSLENAGYAAYVVGGCVRDSLLGLEPHDYDICTAATPEAVCSIFSHHDLIHAGEKHGTIGVILSDNTVCEITTFRSEGDYRDSRHPEWVRFEESIDADLSRRDFTVNAMAWSPVRGLADPFGGQEDLSRGILRAVGDPQLRFREDSLRILRGIRFAARYRLRIEDNTRAAMELLAPTMEHLAKERIFCELCGYLQAVTAQDLLRDTPILTQVIPELEPTVGFEQRTPHHAYDVFTHIAHVTQTVPNTLPLRWAALLHDVGKPAAFTQDETGRGHFKGHGPLGAEMADAILRRLKAPTSLREQVVTLIGLHMTKLEPEKKVIRRWLSRWGQEMLSSLLILQRSDTGSKGIDKPEELAQFDRLDQLFREVLAENACLKIRDLAVDGHDLLKLGFRGPEVGIRLDKLLDLVLDEQVPNEKNALLAALKEL